MSWTQDDADAEFEREWMERYHGQEFAYMNERPSDYELGIENEDRPEYRGYWDKPQDNDWPWQPYTYYPRGEWDNIPF